MIPVPKQARHGTVVILASRAGGRRRLGVHSQTSRCSRYAGDHAPRRGGDFAGELIGGRWSSSEDGQSDPARWVGGVRARPRPERTDRAYKHRAVPDQLRRVSRVSAGITATSTRARREPIIANGNITRSAGTDWYWLRSARRRIATRTGRFNQDPYIVGPPRPSTRICIELGGGRHGGTCDVGERVEYHA